MDKVFNLLIVGVGGQGTILASNIVTQAAMNAGLDAKKSEIHGMSQRGGAVFSHVRFGKKVYSPVIAKGNVDVLISLEEMETLRWTEFLNKDSQLIVLNNRILPANTAEYPQGLTDKIKSQLNNVVSIDPEEYSKKLGNAKYLNVFLLGVLSNYVELPEDCWKNAIESLVPQGTFDKNYEAFLTGKEYK